MSNWALIHSESLWGNSFTCYGTITICHVITPPSRIGQPLTYAGVITWPLVDVVLMKRTYVVKLRSPQGAAVIWINSMDINIEDFFPKNSNFFQEVNIKHENRNLWKSPDYISAWKGKSLIVSRRCIIGVFSVTARLSCLIYQKELLK